MGEVILEDPCRKEESEQKDTGLEGYISSFIFVPVEEVGVDGEKGQVEMAETLVEGGHQIFRRGGQRSASYQSTVEEAIKYC